MGENVYTVKNGEKWGSRKEGASRLSKEFDTQSEAIKYSREQAQKNNSEHRIQGKDGKFRAADSYGKDPYPPKG
ncbi:DUF2188 domain-containing protein [Planococcus halotolerans]|uniref:DUF2188 domain-containing protein n=1 Tax=Planococcus halotolerans TaxID=2233542 RepID=A0A365KX16_9BACL|nr:DUF2188 domain-containing protein [Planococcus halotolerans]QHJ72274.1 DUF2188 domain-containing protein [Planococcus halotolerans]RAZ77704.1 DUF2188 domain-containing protein [Planococcus halotolerans]